MSASTGAVLCELDPCEPFEQLRSDVDAERAMRIASTSLLRAIETAQGKHLTPLPPMKPARAPRCRLSYVKPNRRILHPVVPSMTPDEIIKHVADAFDISPKLLKAGRRSREYVLTRQVVCRLMRDRTWGNGEPRYSLNQIARRINRDHSSVIHLLQTFDTKSAEYPEMRDIYDGLRWAI